MEIFIKYFENFYQTDQIFCPMIQNWDTEWCLRFSDVDANSLASMPNDHEIWKALKSMKPYKAPGSDGIHAGFFQRFWLVVGNSMKSEVKSSFANQRVPEYLNQTLVALIPK